MITTLLKALSEHEAKDDKSYKQCILRSWEQLKDIGNCLQEDDLCYVRFFKPDWLTVGWKRLGEHYILSVEFDLRDNDISYYLNGVRLNTLEFSRNNVGDSVRWLWAAERGLNKAI